MIHDILTVTVGLVVGVLTGFFFERRASKAAREQNKELEAELESVRHSVYSMGGAAHESEPVTTELNLIELVRQRASAIQDPGGRLVKGILVSYFVARGYRAGDIEEAIDQLCSMGAARSTGKWLEMA